MATGDSLLDMQTTVLEFIDDLKENVFTESSEQGDFMLVEFFFKRMHREKIMNHIIASILPWKKKIIVRDEDFFIKNTDIFKGLPDDRVTHYGKVITGARVSEDDRVTIWSYFDTMVAIAEEYKKNK